MSSIGYFSSIGGSGGQASPFVINSKSPGGAIRGYMPQQNQTVDKEYSRFENIRFTLKQSWNTDYPRQLRQYNLKETITTPFRAVNNAGDLMGRLNYSCGGSCQTPQYRPGLHGLKKNFGAVSTSCTPSAAFNSLQTSSIGIPASACNGRYVYDSSDYVTYLKQKSVNKNYNDLTYGGDDNNATQSVVKAIRRY